MLTDSLPLRLRFGHFTALKCFVKPLKPPTETFKSGRNNEVGESSDSYSVNFTFLEGCLMFYTEQLYFGIIQFRSITFPSLFESKPERITDLVRTSECVNQIPVSDDSTESY